ncbi:hypothetical protein BDY19DRAFT_490725 [Irpex rosettiformis]|uniref:Uncharacterized protein n=1 Tax=Irpex rosettiformis TaxID=378272 RepID=A0ACB8UDT8_9APHY|nr:hypothetical protein BDY19DRAFT_490725 [Irpex rosettiformis]
MDYTAATTSSRFEDVDTDRKRLDAFKLGGNAPLSASSHRGHRSSHSRSHSRHTSVSLSFSAPPLSPSPSVSSDSPPASPPPNTGGSKRNSHHRRRSSVSTRRESAEIMGLSLPVLSSSSSSEDNINLGDKDSIRRRALLALEGRSEVGAFSRVEIPELSTPDLEKRFDFPSKPSYPPGIGAGYGSGLSSITSNKRDSYGKFMSMSSSKDVLGTLVEEEEEEEHSLHVDETPAPVTVHELGTVSSPVELIESPTPAPVRPRPATLKLRPLSLSSSVQATNNDLPTPAETPTHRPGLRSLTLSPSLSGDNNNASDDDTMPSWATRRQSMIISRSSPTVPPARRLSLSNVMDSTTTPARPTRRPSIPYFGPDDRTPIGHYGLPTPELTPISDRRYSQDSSSSGCRNSRSLSVSEQHFLFQAHNALVQRISDLERALSARPHSRPQSYASETSSQNDLPSDEMLQLIADLKAERDELKKDVDGWRSRIADFEHQITLLMKRVENERREAWVARERVGLMELEKKAVEATLTEKTTWGEEGWRKVRAIESALSHAMEECQHLRPQADRVPDLELDISRLTVALAEERKKREEIEKELESVLSTPTPQAFELSQYRTAPVPRAMTFVRRGGLGFRSVDSSSSSTDVESIDDSLDRHQLSLKVVQEEDEDDNLNDDLARYEDEDENDDYTFQTSISDSSFGSDSDEPRDNSHLTEMVMDGDYLIELSSASSSSPPTPTPPSPQQSHERRASLIKAWTFPQVLGPSTSVAREAEEVDRFFGCLEDVDNSPPMDAKLRSIESEKNLFSQALADAEDDVPFMIPSDIGVEVVLSSSQSTLHSIAEDEEEEEGKEAIHSSDEDIVGQEVDGGIIFTFTPPPLFEGPETIEHKLSVLTVSEPQPAVKFAAPPQTSSVSSIPRSSSSRTFISHIPVHSTSTPVKSPSTRIPRMSECLSSPSMPVKRGIPSSSIPRLSQSPPSPALSPKARSSSFIPQPRKNQPATATPMKVQSKPRMSMYDSIRSIKSRILS